MANPKTTQKMTVCEDCRKGDCDSCYEWDCPCNQCGHRKPKTKKRPAR